MVLEELWRRGSRKGGKLRRLNGRLAGLMGWLFMSRKNTIGLLVGAVCLSFLVITLGTRISPRFVFSVPLSGGDQEFRAELPSGTYAVALGTNFDNRTFSVIPPQRAYSSEICIEVRSNERTISQNTNAHYFSFSVRGKQQSDIRILVSVRGRRPNEELWLSVARGF